MSRATATRWTQRLLLALVLALPMFWQLGREEFHGDESHWTTSGQEAFYLLTSGRFSDPQWREQFYLYSQPQVGKFLIGAALAASGRYGPTAIYDYDWQHLLWENRLAGRVPPEHDVLAARVAGAVAGWLSCLLLWAIATGLGSEMAGVFAALLLASHPLWLANARRAGLDAPALGLGLAFVWCIIRAVGRWQTYPLTPSLKGRGFRVTAVPLSAFCWLLLAGVCLGLSAGAKYVGLLTVPAAVAAGAPLLRRRMGLAVARGVALLAVAGSAFFVANPTLYRRPVFQLRASIDFLATQARDMRRESQAFSSPSLVAAEIFDRAVWPTRFPSVVDTTLPHVLIPGSYGTPAVALGALAALGLALGTTRARARVFAVALAWVIGTWILLALSVPIWWERWHLPLIPALCLLAGVGLMGLPLPRFVAWAIVAAQIASAFAMEPSFLGKGFDALVYSPVGAAAHLAALAVGVAALVSLGARSVRQRRRDVRRRSVARGDPSLRSG